MRNFAPFIVLLSTFWAIARSHVRLTFPPARDYALDFMDNARTRGPCGFGPRSGKRCPHQPQRLHSGTLVVQLLLFTAQGTQNVSREIRGPVTRWFKEDLTAFGRTSTLERFHQTNLCLIFGLSLFFEQEEK